MAANAAAEERIEAVLEELTYNKGVVGTVLCMRDGTLLRDTFEGIDRSIAAAHADAAAELTRVAAHVLTAMHAATTATTSDKTASSPRNNSDDALQTIELMTTSRRELHILCCDESSNNNSGDDKTNEYLLVVAKEAADA